MIQQDQMFRKLVVLYAPKLAKAKKQYSFMQQNNIEIQQIPLQQAITEKQDGNKMKDSYNPQLVQAYWDQWWNKNKFFHADNTSKNPKKFIICLPPPNITGYLHIGHALTIAIQDAIVRYKRMQGYQTLYLPGTDHAGIATQIVVEKMMKRQQGLSRFDVTRQQFINRVWKWKHKYGNGIIKQIKKVGGSLDWDRQVFTMDKQMSQAVIQGFIQLFQKNLIYRSNRLVNWSTNLKTAISDIEVQYINVDGRTMIQVPNYDKKVEFGVLVYFSYKMKDDPTKQIIVATTRIQTMLGDVAVAVHPQDNRYKDWIGKQLIHPFIKNRKIIVIADTFVQKQFGTGAVKITPAHDFNDYSCGQRNKLQFINILTDNGLINQNGGKYKGIKRFQCRKIIQEDLKKIGLWKQKLNHKMRLSICSRSKDIIEPIIKPQWYVKCTQISKQMIRLVQTKQLKLIPIEQQQTWFRWIKNLKDWCISRQLWWGHRIPIYLIYHKNSQIPSSLSIQNWVAARNINQAKQKGIIKLGLQSINDIEVQQDQDVLDTWFSSGLFPFSPLKWPNLEHNDLLSFFPNSLLETGHDILFFWVARMVMMSLWLTNKLPFKQVLLHPLICDSQGNKMSKSRGNVIDPLEIIQGTSLTNLITKIKESNLNKGQQQISIKKIKHQFPQGISQCGSDALRFGLLSYMIQGRTINLNITRIVSYRKFCNKIWNTFKFAMDKLKLIQNFNENKFNIQKQNFLNSWIILKLNKSIIQMNINMNKYLLGQVTNIFYNFWLYQLCDIYLQSIKIIYQYGTKQEIQYTTLTLFYCIKNGLLLLHPLMPFLTQQLYQKLPDFIKKQKSITKASYPTYQYSTVSQQYFNKIEIQFDIILKCASCFRSISSNVNLPSNIKPQGYIITDEKILKIEIQLLTILSKCGKIIIIQNQQFIPKGCSSSNFNNTKIFLQLGSYINIDKEIKRFQKKIQEIRHFKEILLKKINTQNQQKIPQKIRIQQENQLKIYIEEENINIEAIERIHKLQKDEK